MLRYLETTDSYRVDGMCIPKSVLNRDYRRMLALVTAGKAAILRGPPDTTQKDFDVLRAGQRQKFADLLGVPLKDLVL